MRIVNVAWVPMVISKCPSFKLNKMLNYGYAKHKFIAFFMYTGKEMDIIHDNRNNFRVNKRISVVITKIKESSTALMTHVFP